MYKPVSGFIEITVNIYWWWDTDMGYSDVYYDYGIGAVGNDGKHIYGTESRMSVI